uniref:Uncharacterized protein n=1 Tax=Chromera velia CCMP2878 TaxID=1169474 RepID=A0A0G4F9W1_9ALVE|eukprot:Cvel_15958.t1-p1 / transcript=Cvel_15958.t1 / gene=Cvel_15958 / organism=Chromera_velia_CCMP2878 / gene_product=hypothetical protein / transcript_product=hypothetical protein / location=Cvel_scaffold1207:21735-22760(+) / protein_length=342 / sequence_SO=supercontig / SO=protein_coding / is_pseudo=false
MGAIVWERDVESIDIFGLEDSTMAVHLLITGRLGLWRVDGTAFNAVVPLAITPKGSVICRDYPLLFTNLLGGAIWIETHLAILRLIREAERETLGLTGHVGAWHMTDGTDQPQIPSFIWLETMADTRGEVQPRASIQVLIQHPWGRHTSADPGDPVWKATINLRIIPILRGTSDKRGVINRLSEVIREIWEVSHLPYTRVVLRGHPRIDSEPVTTHSVLPVRQSLAAAALNHIRCSRLRVEQWGEVLTILVTTPDPIRNSLLLKALHRQFAHAVGRRFVKTLARTLERLGIPVQEKEVRTMQQMGMCGVYGPKNVTHPGLKASTSRDGSDTPPRYRVGIDTV